MNWSRLFTILITGSVVLIGAVAFLGRPEQTTVIAQEDATTVELVNIEVSVDATGKVAPIREVPMRFGNTYVVAEVFVEEGDTVREGDVLATLDMAEYDLLVARAQTNFDLQDNNFNDVVAPPRDVDLLAAQAQVDAAEAAYWAAGQTAPTAEEIEIARLGVEVAKNDLWQGQLNRDITVQIDPVFRTNAGQNAWAQEIQLNDGLNQLETGVEIAGLEYQERQTEGPNGNQFGASVEQRTSAQISRDNLLNPDEFDIERTALSVHRAALDLERLEVQVVDMQIVAPFDGIVMENHLEVGSLPPEGPAIVIADNSTFTVDLEVDETDVVNLVQGMPVDITIDALPEAELVGSISTIDQLPLPDEAVPTYRVTVELAPSEERIQAGMSADGEILVAELSDVTAVPTRYIETTADGTFVTIIDAGELSRVPVTTGRTSGIYTQIIDGLTPGQRVVLPQAE